MRECAVNPFRAHWLVFKPVAHVLFGENVVAVLFSAATAFHIALRETPSSLASRSPEVPLGDSISAANTRSFVPIKNLRIAFTGLEYHAENQLSTDILFLR